MSPRRKLKGGGKMNCGMTLELKVPGASLSPGLPVVRESVEYPPYDGPTEVTPSQEAQVLSTANKSVLSDIVVNPIPSNYGLVTYNGAIIIIS